VVATRGLGRAALRFLRYYWVNSGLAVAIMLLLGWGNGYKVLWSIFGSANQLLAALALVIGSLWLIHKGRPVRYLLIPALFMLATSLTMLVRLLVKDYLPAWPKTAPLVITDLVVLAMSVGITLLAARSWLQTRRKDIL